MHRYCRRAKRDSAQTAQKRWGTAGVNYFANLAEAGHSPVAAILQTLPSFSKSVIAAEQIMRTLTLSPNMLMGQLAALKQDLLNPEIMDNASRRAWLQAESALISQKIAGGALGGLSGLKKDVEDAKAVHDKNLSDLDQAGKEEQAASRLHAMVSEKFLSNLADSAIGNSLLAVIDQWKAAAEKRKNVEAGAADKLPASSVIPI